MKLAIYLSAHDDTGVPILFRIWDSDKEGALKLYLGAFANDAVVTVEPWLGDSDG